MNRNRWPTFGRLPKRESAVLFTDELTRGYGSEELAKLTRLAAAGYGSLVAAALRQVETDAQAPTSRICAPPSI